MQADFLITHIDHAVERWQVSPYAKSLSFSGFANIFYLIKQCRMVGIFMEKRCMVCWEIN